MLNKSESKFFTITHEDKHSNARTGILHTKHGDVATPYFMAVATKAHGKCIKRARNSKNSNL